MAIVIRETFQLEAPIDDVWRFLVDPRRVVPCMPGAGLDEVIDDHTFLGTMRVKVGPILTSYKGRAQFVHIDADAHRIELLAEGRESAGGGSARATMVSHLTSLPGGGTEVVAETRAEITGRIMQFGQGMIQGVAHQLFLEFVACTRTNLDAAAEAGGVAAPAESEPLSILPVLLKTVWAAVVSVWRKLVRRRPAQSS